MSDDAERKAPPVAVALAYEHGSVPTVVAKGRGEIARKIIASAEEHGVIVEENPALAEALSRVALEKEIPVELYRAVAEVIGYVLRMSGRLK